MLSEKKMKSLIDIEVLKININDKLTNAKLTKLAVDRAEYLLTSAELGRLAFAELGLFDDERFSAEPELRAPRSNFLFFADIPRFLLKENNILAKQQLQITQLTSTSVFVVILR